MPFPVLQTSYAEALHAEPPQLGSAEFPTIDAAFGVAQAEIHGEGQQLPQAQLTPDQQEGAARTILEGGMLPLSRTPVDNTAPDP